MKIVCRRCKEVKKTSEFTPHKGTKRGFRWDCKPCRNEIVRSKNHQHVVYYLPEENYCGVSKNLERRIKLHSKAGKNVAGWRVLFSSKDTNEVLHMEAMYHSVMGMYGLNKANNEN